LSPNLLIIAAPGKERRTGASSSKYPELEFAAGIIISLPVQPAV